MTEIEGRWPDAGAASGRRNNGHELQHAVIFQDGPAKHVKDAKAAACFHASNEEASLDLLLFESLEEALETAKAGFEKPRTSNACCWLDAGVFDKDALKTSSKNVFESLIAGACRPHTDPGAAYATEAFASLAPLSANCSARFDYVGFVPTREKLDPCALYLARFPGS